MQTTLKAPGSLPLQEKIVTWLTKCSHPRLAASEQVLNENMVVPDLTKCILAASDPVHNENINY